IKIKKIETGFLVLVQFIDFSGLIFLFSPVPSSNRFTKPVPTSNRFTKPVPTSNRFTKPVQTSNRFTKPVPTSNRFTKPVPSSNRFSCFISSTSTLLRLLLKNSSISLSGASSGNQWIL
ncbi:hypothetical protein BpHYR1_004432, partial [Brachionus plicatilis]